MNKIILQLWEESNKNNVFLSDGCSLHVDIEERENYISKIYNDRSISLIPDRYDRIVGNGSVVFVMNSIFEIIEKNKTVKLSEIEFRNLLKLEKIILNENEI